MSALAAEGMRVLAMDVTQDDSMCAAVEQITSDLGRIDVLVNNAGYGSYGALEDVPLAEARYQFEVNVFGMARLIQLVLPTMRSARSGTIINVSSVAGKIWEPFGCWYHATKFAVEGLSDSLRVELKRFGINVVVIEPGVIKTEWNQIARENLVKVSGDTAYGDAARAYAGRMARFDESRLASNPDVVARAIGAAASAKKPKTRYAVGGGARTVLAAKAVLPDRAVDTFITRTISD